jgi:hypothetical protein
MFTVTLRTLASRALGFWKQPSLLNFEDQLPFGGMPESMSLFVQVPPRCLAFPAPINEEESAPEPKKARAPRKSKSHAREGAAL